MLPLFFAALSNVVGLGVIVPLLPFYAGEAGAGPAAIAWLFAVFSLAQFVTAPLWGRLSDRIGRKPIIAISFAGSVAGYIWLAQADGLASIFLARIFSGAMNGWLATSQAYIADVTTPERRARGMGVLGAAFGIGFVIGPALGGYLVGGDVPNYRLPMTIAAGGSAIALLIALIALREPDRHAAEPGARTSLPALLRLAPITAAFVAFNFCLFYVFSGMESTFAVWCRAALDMGPRAVGYYLSFAGICAAFVQAWLVGRVVAWTGEGPAIIAGFVALTGGLLLLPAVAAPPMLLPAIALLAMGFGLANPSLLSLVSREAPADIRGGALGLMQSGASLGRVFGPAWAGFAFAALGISWPFLSGAIVLVPVIGAAVYLSRRISRNS